MQDDLGKNCNVLPVFSLNSAKRNSYPIKSYLLPLLVHERKIERKVIKKANQFVSFKFGKVQLLDILSFLGEATSFDVFLVTYKTSETKRYFPLEWFNDEEKLKNIQLSPYQTSPNLTLFVFTCYLLQQSITSQRATGIYWRTFGKIWLVDHLLFLFGKLLWTRFLVRTRQTWAKVLPEFMPVSFIFSLRVKQCQLVWARDGS